MKIHSPQEGSSMRQINPPIASV